MIEILSSWAKGLGITIVIVSIFEMLLPNNRTKKYIRMVLGVYVIFNIVSPLIKNKETGELMPEGRIIDSKELLGNPYKKLVELLIEQPKNDKLCYSK